MHNALIQLCEGLQLTGDPACDVPVFLTYHGWPDTAKQCS